MFAYRIETTSDDNDTWLVTCPDLPEVTTFAEAAEDIEHRAAEAIEEALGARISAGQDIPKSMATPDSGAVVIAPSLLVVLKVELYQACRDAEMTRAQLARALGWHREQVDRLFRLDHASKVDQLEAALSKLGRSFDVSTRAA